MYLYFGTCKKRKRERERKRVKERENEREKKIYISYIYYLLYICYINKVTSFHDIQGDIKYETEALGQHGRLTFENSVLWTNLNAHLHVIKCRRIS